MVNYWFTDAHGTVCELSIVEQDYLHEIGETPVYYRPCGNESVQFCTLIMYGIANTMSSDLPQCAVKFLHGPRYYIHVVK